VVASAHDREKNRKVAIKKVGKMRRRYPSPQAGHQRFRRPHRRQAHRERNQATQYLPPHAEFFKHDNLNGLVDILKPEARAGYTDIYIITELMETDLHRVIYSRQELSDEHIQYFVYQILRGLLFMHSANVLHRDLKPSNLLLVTHSTLRTRAVTFKFAT
jgi:serine/threonine protein kinase